MKIVFDDYQQFDIYSITYHFDDQDKPIDIIIYADMNTLNKISEDYAHYGGNIQECSWAAIANTDMWEHYVDHVGEALFARLENFKIKYADKVQYYE